MKTNASTTTNQTATVATQGAHVAPETATATKKARGRQAAPKANRGAKKPASKKTAKRAASKKDATASVPREFSKKAIVLDLLRRKNGATMDEIAKATGWQNHSIRGFISGTVAKKMGLAVESAKTEQGFRMYRIAK